MTGERGSTRTLTSSQRPDHPTIVFMLNWYEQCLDIYAFLPNESIFHAKMNTILSLSQ